jgi:predicted  nucleic acid-binding Zn-ribbon protein
MSIRDQLARLVELQVAELELSQLEATLAEFPAQRSGLQAEVDKARELISAAETSRDDSAKHRRTLEGELQTAEARIDKYREQEMQVKTNEQLWAIQGEIRGVEGEVERVETGILEEMERADAASRAIETAQQELKTTEARVAAAIAQVDDSESKVLARVEHDRTKIQELRGGVGELLGVYDRVKSVRAGVGVAEIGPDGNCQACRVRLRPQLVLEASQMEEPCQCENCRRILFSRAALELPDSLQLTAD